MTPTNTIQLRVFRYDPQRGGEGSWSTYDVPFHDDWVVLDALNWIKDEVDGTLTYRWSCRMGVCGSCGMSVNGEPKLTCATFLRDYHPAPVTVGPLGNFAVERDLVVAMDDFMAKLKAVKPWLIRSDTPRPAEGELRQSPGQLAHFKQFSMCINCMLCYAACPEYAFLPHFIGPAALALGQRYNLDSRDEGAAERMSVMGRSEGVWDCTFVGECSVVCPKDVDPAAAIQQGKVASMIGWYRGIAARGGDT
jgi:fumarate reductase iron-sulfur subunit